MPELRPLLVRALQNTGLNKVAHQLYYGYVHGFDTASPALLPALDACFEASIDRGLAHQGDYFEFGVFKGYSFWYAQERARRHELGRMRFYGFDSFSGLPPVRGRDRTTLQEFYEGQYACSKDRLVANLNAKGVDWSRMHLTEGYFEHSLNDELKAEFRERRIAMPLSRLRPLRIHGGGAALHRRLIADGTILLFDDWNCFDAHDERVSARASRGFWNGTTSSWPGPCSPTARTARCSPCGRTAPATGRGRPPVGGAKTSPPRGNKPHDGPGYPQISQLLPPRTSRYGSRGPSQNSTALGN